MRNDSFPAPPTPIHGLAPSVDHPSPARVPQFGAVAGTAPAIARANRAATGLSTGGAS